MNIQFVTGRCVYNAYLRKGAEAACVEEIASEMKKLFRLKDMLNFNLL